MALFVSTTGSTVEVPELGISIVHPTSDFDVTAQFSVEEIKAAASLTAAIQAGTLAWKFLVADVAQNAASYDPDMVDLLDEDSGTGIGAVRSIVLSNSTLTLKAGDTTRMFFTGSTVGQIIKLPVCTNLIIGLKFEIFNIGSVSITLNYQDNSSLITIPASTKTEVILQGISANGSWFILQFFSNVASGIVNYKVTSSTTFTTASAADVVITGFTIIPQAGTYAIWHNASCTIATNNTLLRTSVYKAGVLIADSTRASQASGGGWSGMASTMTTSQFNGSQACDIRVRSSTGSISVLDRTLILIRLGN